jgi:hypothetical protein
MRRKARAFVPQATALESRSLLSATATTAPGAAEVSILSERSGTTAPVAITNTIRGTYFAPEDNRAADVPLHVSLDGMGRVRGIGRAKLSGSLDLGGFRLAGQADITGTLTLTNGRGTVTLRLTGSGGFAEVPNGRFVTSVSSIEGTGAYARFHRKGTVTFLFGPNEIRCIRAPCPIGGAMTVRLSLKPRIR